MITNSEALSPLMPLYQPAPGLYLVMGPSGLPSWFHAAVAPARERGLRLSWVDGRRCQSPEPIARRLRDARPGEAIVLSDPLASLKDEDMPAAEAEGLLEDLLDAVRESRAVCIVLAPSRPEAAGRGSMLARLIEEAHRVAELWEHGARWQLELTA